MIKKLAIAAVITAICFAGIAARFIYLTNQLSRVELPEEINQISSDPNRADTLYGYQRNGQYFIEMRNYKK